MQMMQYKNLFLEEARQKLSELEEAFLRLEKKPNDAAVIQTILLALHSLKGSASTMNFNSMATALHQSEEVFSSAKIGRQTLKSRDIDNLFIVLDALRQDLQEIKQHDTERDLTSVMNLLLKMAEPPLKPDLIARRSSSRKTSAQDIYQPLVSRVDVATDDLEMVLDQVNNAIAGNHQVMRQLQKNDGSGVKLGLHSLASRLSLLRQTLMQVKLVPVKQYFAFVPRFVRDLARQGTKFIRLEFKDNNLKFERQVLESLREICIQLIKNAVDHGFRDGETGKVSVAFEFKNQHIEVKVTDNGHGIDWPGLMAKAAKNKKGSKPASGALSQEAKDALLFAGGVSTKTTATVTSGRGIGLSVVRSKLSELNGALTYSSASSGPKRGTTFTVLIPVAQTMFRSLTWHWGNYYVALPLFVLVKIVQLTQEQAQHLGQKFTYQHSTITVFDWARFLGLGRSVVQPLALAIIEWQGERRALPLPGSVREQELILETLPCLAGNGLLAGAAVAEDSTPVLILNHQQFFNGNHGKKENTIR